MKINYYEKYDCNKLIYIFIIKINDIIFEIFDIDDKAIKEYIDEYEVEKTVETVIEDAIHIRCDDAWCGIREFANFANDETLNMFYKNQIKKTYAFIVDCELIAIYDDHYYIFPIDKHIQLLEYNNMLCEFNEIMDYLAEYSKRNAFGFIVNQLKEILTKNKLFIGKEFIKKSSIIENELNKLIKNIYEIIPDDIDVNMLSSNRCCNLINVLKTINNHLEYKPNGSGYKKCEKSFNAAKQN